jgi:hypothetical protein
MVCVVASFELKFVSQDGLNGEAAAQALKQAILAATGFSENELSLPDSS